ncbi:unnamed protein product, partial [Cyprideis torosa]
PIHLAFFGDDFLRLLLLRFVFCTVALRLHRGFRLPQFLPTSLPALPEMDLTEHANLQRLIWELAVAVDGRSHFVDPGEVFQIFPPAPHCVRPKKTKKWLNAASGRRQRVSCAGAKLLNVATRKCVVNWCCCCYWFPSVIECRRLSYRQSIAPSNPSPHLPTADVDAAENLRPVKNPEDQLLNALQFSRIRREYVPVVSNRLVTWVGDPWAWLVGWGLIGVQLIVGLQGRGLVGKGEGDDRNDQLLRRIVVVQGKKDLPHPRKRLWSKEMFFAVPQSSCFDLTDSHHLKKSSFYRCPDLELIEERKDEFQIKQTDPRHRMSSPGAEEALATPVSKEIRDRGRIWSRTRVSRLLGIPRPLRMCTLGSMAPMSSVALRWASCSDSRWGKWAESTGAPGSSLSSSPEGSVTLSDVEPPDSCSSSATTVENTSSTSGSVACCPLLSSVCSALSGRSHRWSKKNSPMTRINNKKHWLVNRITRTRFSITHACSIITHSCSISYSCSTDEKKSERA